LQNIFRLLVVDSSVVVKNQKNVIELYVLKYNTINKLETD